MALTMMLTNVSAAASGCRQCVDVMAAVQGSPQPHMYQTCVAVSGMCVGEPQACCCICAAMRAGSNKGTACGWLEEVTLEGRALHFSDQWPTHTYQWHNRQVAQQYGTVLCQHLIPLAHAVARDCTTCSMSPTAGLLPASPAE